jgi:colicin import membrane protein
MLPRGGSGAPPAPPPPPPPPPLPQDLAPPQGEEEEDSSDEEFLAELPTDTEAEEAAIEQRAIVASFETQRRDRAAQELMTAERRAAAARLVEDHTAARADAHCRNIEAARATMAEAERRLFQADVAVGLAKVAAER